MKHFLRLLGLMLTLAFCVGLLSTTPALAQEPWEHSSHDNSWKALTAESLTGQGQLTSGKYYFSSDDPYKNFSSDTQLVVGKDQIVTLCLNDVMYTYIGSEEAAIVVEEGGTLTVCCCKMDPDLVIYTQGSLSCMGGKYAILNKGTLTVADSSISGVEGEAAIYNDVGASLTLSGMPMFNSYNTNKTYDIYTSNTIHVKELGKDYSGSMIYPSVSIGFYGNPGDVVVDGFTDEMNNSDPPVFTLAYPEGAEFAYDDEKKALVYAVQSSLQYCGQPVQSQTYYKVENVDYSYEPGGPVFKISGLTLGDENDYDLY